jgi:putative CocE/NonD family hydrolase
MSLGVTVEQDLRLSLPDGVSLSADVYTPERAGRYPTLLMRLPYGATVASAPVYRHPAWYAAQGFCVVVQDVRGTWRSGGAFYPRRDELPDTLATIEWAASLPRSNGHVGMYGFSYQGVVQLQAAACRPPALAAIAPAQTSGDFYGAWHYEGGVPINATAVGWGLQCAWIAAIHDQRDADARRYRQLQMDVGRLLALPPALPEEIRDIPWIRDWLTHETYDVYWQEQAIAGTADLPALWTAGWYDSLLQGTLRARQAATSCRGVAGAGAEQSLIVGPWQHQPWSRYVGVRDFGPAAISPVDAEHVAFFKHYLDNGNGDGLARQTMCRVFVTGLDAWRTLDRWPPATSVARWHLDSDGDATSERGTGNLGPDAPTESGFDVFTSEPLVPVPVTGGRGAGPADQRAVERLRAVAVYTSAPLERDTWVTGGWTHLLVATSGSDCDWIVRVCDVDPSGRSVDVTQGALRARYRFGQDRCAPVQPFATDEVDVTMWPCSHQFKPGHRIRLQVAGSSFPYYARNPGDCLPVVELPAHAYRAVSQFVLHGPGQSSWLALETAELDASEPWSYSGS